MAASARRSVYLIDRYCDHSTHRRNTFDHILFKQPVESFCRCLPTQCFARARVQRVGDGAQLVSTMLAEIRALGEVLAEQTVGVFVTATLPWALRVAEVDLETGIDPQLRVLGHLGAWDPRQRLAQNDGQRSDRIAHSFSAMPRQRGTVLDPRLRSVTAHSR